MSNTVLFYTQIASIIGFITALFILYRILVAQKDATIQLLKEKIDWLQKQLDLAKEASPDILVKQLDQRVRLFAEELERLSKDKNTSDALLKQKDEELQELRAAAQRAAERLQRISQAFQNASEAIKKVGSEAKRS